MVMGKKFGYISGFFNLIILAIYVEKFKAMFEVITRWRNIKCLPRLIRE